MNTAVLGLASNLVPRQEAELKLDRALDALAAAGCPCLKDSSRYILSGTYVNQTVEISTPLDFDALHALSKEIESRLGRDHSRKGLPVVPIDIDIVLYNGEIKRQRDYDSPYFIKGYLEIS